MNHPQNAKPPAKSIGHPAEPDEIVGCWELVQWTPEAKAGQQPDPWPLPYQYFAFYPDGTMTYRMSTEYSPITPQEFEHMRKLSGNTAFVLSKGLMTVTRKNAPAYREIWGVTIVTKPWSAHGIDFLPGDLVMSLDDGKGKDVYLRHLRRIK